VGRDHGRGDSDGHEAKLAPGVANGHAGHRSGQIKSVLKGIAAKKFTHFTVGWITQNFVCMVDLEDR
jgi:hypothetical protein